jgi:hypothetical protein
MILSGWLHHQPREGSPHLPSPASREYFRRLHDAPSFGTSGFGLEGLRLGMASRSEPAAVPKKQHDGQY